jgi:hypothetical protein
VSYRRWRAAAQILTRPGIGEAPPSCFPDRKVEDDLVGPACQTYRSDIQARPRMGWLAGLAKLGCGQVSFPYFFSVLLSFLFTLFSVFDSN